MKLGSAILILVLVLMSCLGSCDRGCAGDSKTSVLPWSATARKEARHEDDQVSPLDLLKDQLAYRDAVNGAIRQRELDDTHDLRGFTLYSLKFNLSVLPGKYAHNNLAVLLEIKGRNARKDNDYVEEDKSLYRAWLHSLNDELQLETEQCLKRLLLDQLPESQLHLLLLDFRQGVDGDLSRIKPLAANAGSDRTANFDICKNPEFNFSAAQAISQFEQFIFMTREERKQLFKEKDATKLSELKYVAATAILSKYSTRLGTYAKFKKMIASPGVSSSGPPNYFFFTDVDEQQDECLRSVFSAKLASLGQANVPRELSVEPQEIAQDISDVSSRQDTINLALTLGAVFHQINVSSATNSLQQSQVLLQAIRRQPLVVGFGDRRQRFGWVLGPSFFIRSNGTAGFKFSAVTQTVTAELAVPAWWSNIVIDSHIYEVGDDGSLSEINSDHPDPFDLPVEEQASITKTTPSTGGHLRTREKDSKPAPTGEMQYTLELIGQPNSKSEWAPSKEKNRMVVELPSDIPAITTALIYENSRVQRMPVIQPTWHAETPNPSPPYCMQASSGSGPGEQTLLIQGRDLWRNPKVFVGSLAADRVDVLPDMNGVLAHFKTVPMPAKTTAGNATIDLTVVTSFGYDMVPNAVTILPPQKPATGSSAFVSLPLHFAVDAGTSYSPNLVFALDQSDGEPHGLGGVTLLMRQKGHAYAEWTAIKTTTPEFSASQIGYVLTRKDVAAVPGTTQPTDASATTQPSPLVLDVDLQVPVDPTQKPNKSILKGSSQTLVFFYTEAQAQLDQKGAKSQGSVSAKNLSPVLIISIPGATDPRMLAYPELAVLAANSGSTDVTLVLKLTGDANSQSFVTNGTLQDRTMTFRVLPDKPLHPGTYDVSVQVEDGSGKPYDIPAGQVQLKP
jgi:hypothetical protein